MHLSSALGLAALLVATANAQLRGFNYGAFFLNQQPKHQADFEYEFNAARQLPGTNGQMTAARLYTMIQHGTANTPISAIQAAINTRTQLFLGLWASVDSPTFNNEIAALRTAINQYGRAFTDLVVGISVGSEDLYRISPTGIENKSGIGAQPSTLVDYIRRTRDAVRNTALAGKPIGHVDTWTAFVNDSNSAVISASDFLGMDAYPYFQTTMDNHIDHANQTFYDAYFATVNKAQGKPVWVAETGWPVSGPQQNRAVASPQNARRFWQDVTCSLFDRRINLFYYTFQDAQWGQPSPSFGVKPAGDLMAVQPLFDLSCRTEENGSATPTMPSRSSMAVEPSSIISILSLTTFSPTITLPSTRTAIPTSFLVSTPNPTELPGPFEVPRLIVPVDNTDPDRTIGNSFSAEISLTKSTLFNFYLPPTYTGRSCNLTFILPEQSRNFWAPYDIISPGGLTFLQLKDLASTTTSRRNVSQGVSVGSIGQLLPGQLYTVTTETCQAGQGIGYELRSLGGLSLRFFQLQMPPLGLFITASG